MLDARVRLTSLSTGPGTGAFELTTHSSPIGPHTSSGDEYGRGNGGANDGATHYGFGYSAGAASGTGYSTTTGSGSGFSMGEGTMGCEGEGTGYASAEGGRR